MRVFSIALVILFGGVSFFLLKSHRSNPMVGTWEMKSGVYYAPDGKTDFSPDNKRQMKVINESHFTTLWEDAIYHNNRGFNGGTYTYEDGIYTEYLDFFTIEDRVGDTAYFKVDLEDNVLSISACDKDGNISKTGYFQVWERVSRGSPEPVF